MKFYNLIVFATLVPVLGVLKKGTTPYAIIIIFFEYALKGRIPKSIFYFNVITSALLIFKVMLHGDGRIDNYILLLVGPNIFLYFLTSHFLPSKKFLSIFLIFMLITTIPEYYTFLSFRGASGLYSEPSHMGRYVIGAWLILYILYFEKITNPLVYILIFINKSSSSIFIFLIGVLTRFFQVKLFPFVLLILLIVILLVNQFHEQIRMFKQIYVISMNIANFEYDANFLNLIGSRRLLQSVVGFSAAFDYPIGVPSDLSVDSYSNLIGLSLSDVAYIKMRLGENIDNVKPGSFFSEVTFYFGLLGAALCTFFSVFCLLSVQKSRRPLVYVSLFLLTFLSTSTMTIPWLLLGVALNKKALI